MEQAVEVLALLTNAVCLFYTIKRRPVSWVIGIVSTLLLMFLFASKRMWGQEVVQIMFLLQSIIGLIQWERITIRENKVPIQFITDNKVFYLFSLSLIVIFTLFLIIPIQSYEYALIPLSVIGNFLLIRRYIENWIMWMIVHVFSTVFFIYHGFYGIAAMFVLFFLLSITGLFFWFTQLQNERQCSIAQKRTHMRDLPM